MQTTGNLGLKKPEGTDIVDIADLNGNMDILDNAVTGKVDKVSGKQLSTNDYTAAEKTKLAGIAAGANNYLHPNHTGDVTSTGDGVTAIAAGVIVNADVNTSAGIDASKIGTGVVSNAEFGYLDGVTSGIQGQLDSKVPLTDYVRQSGYAVDSGTANAKVITLTPAPTSYVDGMAASFKNAVLSTGAATININGLGNKSIVKSNGSALSSGNLKAGSIYTVRYNATTGNFILQGEGGEYGTATAADVLAPKTIGTENGLVTGTMPTIANNSAPTDIAYWAPGTSNNAQPKARMKMPNGYSDGGSYLSADMPDLLPVNVLQGKTIFGMQGSIPVITVGADPAVGIGVWSDGGLAVYPREGYRKGGAGAGEIKVPLDMIRTAVPIYPEYIKAGVSMFNVVGTLQPKLYATGKATSATFPNQSSAPILSANSFSGSCGTITVTGLTFRPAMIKVTSDDGKFRVVYTTPLGNYCGYVELPNQNYPWNAGSLTLTNMNTTSVKSIVITDSGFTMPAAENFQAAIVATWEAWN